MNAKESLPHVCQARLNVSARICLHRRNNPIPMNNNDKIEKKKMKICEYQCIQFFFVHMRSRIHYFGRQIYSFHTVKCYTSSCQWCERKHKYHICLICNTLCDSLSFWLCWLPPKLGSVHRFMNQIWISHLCPRSLGSFCLYPPYIRTYCASFFNFHFFFCF